MGTHNISAYHRGLMDDSTPNIDRFAKEGMLFIDTLGRLPSPPDVPPSSPGSNQCA